MNRVLFLLMALAVGIMASIAQAEFLTNGDFEDLTGWGDAGTANHPANWPAYKSPRLNPAQQQSGVDAIGSSGTSAYMPSFLSSDDTTRRDMCNTLSTPAESLFRLDFDFASEDPGSLDERSVAGTFYTTGGSINLRVVDSDDNGVGDVEFYNVISSSNKSWVPTLMNAVTFDDDVTTTPLVNHFTLVGHFDDGNAYYDVTVTDTYGNSSTATNLTYSNGAIPTGAALTKLTFNTFVSDGDYLLDNVSVSVPEPSAVLMMICGLTCLVATRRRD